MSRREWGKRAAAAAAAAAIATAKPAPRVLPGEAEPVKPQMNDEEREVIKTLSLAARQRQLERLANALGPTPPSRAGRRAQDNRARNHAKHLAARRGRG